MTQTNAELGYRSLCEYLELHRYALPAAQKGLRELESQREQSATAFLTMTFAMMLFSVSIIYFILFGGLGSESFWTIEVCATALLFISAGIMGRARRQPEYIRNLDNLMELLEIKNIHGLSSLYNRHGLVEKCRAIMAESPGCAARLNELLVYFELRKTDRSTLVVEPAHGKLEPA